MLYSSESPSRVKAVITETVTMGLSSAFVSTVIPAQTSKITLLGLFRTPRPFACLNEALKQHIRSHSVLDGGAS
jgi:hypothetical protein